jgi:membrane protein DedA with SNARE-associated domain
MRSKEQVACAWTFIGSLVMVPLCFLVGVWFKPEWSDDPRWYQTGGCFALLAVAVGVAWIITTTFKVGEDR